MAEMSEENRIASENESARFKELLRKRKAEGAYMHSFTAREAAGRKINDTDDEPAEKE